MDFNIVTLEIADLLTHFNYYNQLVTGAAEEQAKLHKKHEEHLALFFAGVNFYNEKNELLTLPELKALITPKLTELKSKEIHGLVEQLERDTKKMKKLYKATAKKSS